MPCGCEIDKCRPRVAIRHLEKCPANAADSNSGCVLWVAHALRSRLLSQPNAVEPLRHLAGSDGGSIRPYSEVLLRISKLWYASSATSLIARSAARSSR